MDFRKLNGASFRVWQYFCADCKKQYTLTPEERDSLALTINKKALDAVKDVWRGEGCVKCNHTGYVKRIGIYEVLEVTEPVRQMIMRRASSDEIYKAAVESGMTSMLEDGLQKAAQGVTSIAELIRVVHD